MLFLRLILIIVDIYLFVGHIWGGEKERESKGMSSYGHQIITVSTDVAGTELLERSSTQLSHLVAQVCWLSHHLLSPRVRLARS